MLLRSGLVLVGILSLEVCAEDWPQWGGHDDKNMVSMAKGLPDSFTPGRKRTDGTGVDLATTRNVRWAAHLGSQTYGSPVVAGGYVIVGTNDLGLGDWRYEETGGGVLKCFEESTGELAWQLAVRKIEWTKKTEKFRVRYPLGICCSPAVEGNRVYVVTNRGEVVCLDMRGLANGNDGPFSDESHYTRGEDKPPVRLGPKDPDIVWRFDMLHELSIFPHDANCSGALIHGDVLYVGTANGVDDDCTPYPLAPSLIALDKRTGRLVGYDDARIGTRVFHGQWSSPSLGRVGGKTLVFFGGGDGICYAFEALERIPAKPRPLECLWSCDCNPSDYRYRKGKPIDYWAGDVRKTDDNKNDGRYVGPSEIIATPVFYKNRVYVTIGQDPEHGRGRGMLTVIDATQTGDISKTGKVWTFGKLDRSLSTVSIADGLLYVADYPGRLFCLDAETGRCLWSHETKQEVWGSTLVADGKVYLGTKKYLWTFAAGPHKRICSQVRLGTPIWASPIAANGTLYVASQRYLWAVKDLGAKPALTNSRAPTTPIAGR